MSYAMVFEADMPYIKKLNNIEMKHLRFSKSISAQTIAF